MKDSERSRVQLQEALDRLEENKEATEEKIKEREELVSLVDATERAAVSTITAIIVIPCSHTTTLQSSTDVISLMLFQVKNRVCFCKRIIIVYECTCYCVP